jgi:hypothetical protein
MFSDDRNIRIVAVPAVVVYRVYKKTYTIHGQEPEDKGKGNLIFEGTQTELCQKFPRHKRFDLDPLCNYYHDDGLGWRFSFEKSEPNRDWVKCSDPRPPRSRL